MIYKGYEIAKMLTKGEIPEDTLLTVTSNDKPNEINEIYIVCEGALWDVKEVDKKIIKNYETGNSMLTCADIYFRMLKRCENCNEIIENDEIYHKYHGHCCGQCEKKSIKDYNNKIKNLYNQEDKDIEKTIESLNKKFHTIDISPTITLEMREDFFKDMTQEEIEDTLKKIFKGHNLRFF